jgi:hypothetical protein
VRRDVRRSLVTVGDIRWGWSGPGWVAGLGLPVLAGRPGPPVAPAGLGGLPGLGQALEPPVQGGAAHAGHPGQLGDRHPVWPGVVERGP